MSRVLRIAFPALVLTMPGLAARAIDLTPFSAIKSAVEAVEGVKKVYNEMTVIKAVAIVKDIKGVTSVTRRVKVRPKE